MHLSPLSPRETTAWMQEVEERRSGYRELERGLTLKFFELIVE